MASRTLYRINNVNKLKTTTSEIHKERIQKWFKQKFPNTKLSELFYNLGNTKKNHLKTFNFQI